MISLKFQKKEDYADIVMINIGIIAGGGDLPFLVGKSLIEKNFNVTFFVIKKFYKKSLYKKFNVVEIQLNSLKEIITNFKNNNIQKIIMLGNVNRPSINDIKFDLETISFIKKFFLQKKGDNNLLISIKEYFSNKGYEYFDWTLYCKELFADTKNLTNKKPSNNAILNKNKGCEFFRILGKSDLAQSIIVQNEIILGIEASEGTDELIRRCNNYKKKGDKGVLIKLSKYKQSNLLDIPTIGINTLKLIKKFNYEGVFLEINKCLILNKAEVIKFANENNIFISAIEKN